MKLRKILGAVFACGSIALYSATSVLLSPTESYAAPSDFDGDGKSDLVVWRPNTGVWYVYTSTGVCPSQMTPVPVYGGCEIQWGLSSDRPILGDFDANGRPDFAVVREISGGLYWYIRYSTVNANTVVQWGLTGDIESVGDINGDANSDLVVYRPSNHTYYVRQYNIATGAVTTPTYVSSLLSGASWVSGSAGTARYTPNVSHDDPGVHARFMFSGFLRSSFNWFNVSSGTPMGIGLRNQQTPVIGHFAGSSLADWTDYDPATAAWVIQPNLFPAPSPGSQIVVSWGGPQQLPVSGDYDGDGTNDVTVWNAATSGAWLSTWFIKPSSGTCPSFLATLPGGCYWQWGLPGDIPVTTANHH